MWKQRLQAGRATTRVRSPRVNSDGTYDIRFDDGERKRGVRDDQIKSNDDDRRSSSSRQSRREGDRVEAKSQAGRATIRVRSPVSWRWQYTTSDLMMVSASVACVMIKSRAMIDDDRSSPSSSSRKADEKNDRVEAKVAGWTRYYKGEITRVNSDGTYDIRFDDGERKRGVRDDQINR